MYFFTPIDWSHYSVHKSIKVKLPKTKYFTKYFVIYVKILYLSACLVIRKVFNQKQFYYSVLESSVDKLQEYVMKTRSFHLNFLS